MTESAIAQPAEPETSQPNAWDRWDWIWRTVFYATLLVPLGSFLAMEAGTRGENLLAATLVAAGITAQNVVNFRLKQRFRHQAASRIGLFYLAILVGICFGLVLIDPIFYFTLGGILSQIFYNQPMPQGIGASLILTVLLLSAQVDWGNPATSLNDPGLWVFAFMMGLGIFLALWIGAIIGESDQRRQLIHELQKTQSKLATAERQSGILSERQRLAREIHDTLAQGFTSIVMHLEATEQALTSDTLETARHHLDQARRTARESLAQARQVVADLRPDILAQTSLPQALDRVVARWQEQTRTAATFAATGDVLPLHPDTDVTLLRITQEALANVNKHARAQQVTVTLSYMGDVVMLDVIDDGVGMAMGTPTNHPASGFGLVGMRERLAQLGGSLDIESSRGQGTTVAVSIPVVLPA
jgi:signal transduction histidine kinase